jgi:hypothetical protein
VGERPHAARVFERWVRLRHERSLRPVRRPVRPPGELDS